MATITTPTFLDESTARTAGEAWTMNGGRLTIRSDTRWHANAPASLTGSVGSLNISASLGGGVTVDGTKVRWLTYSGGSGNMPAIGTTITQGGTTGYLLGVWATVNSAPTAVGAAIPAAGFLKFREVTGAFAAGALAGITATADGADVPGWIEVVADQSATMTVPRLGDFTVRGDWFSLGTTSGTANQVITIPGLGGVNWGLGLWIETDVADTYEFYPAVIASLMLTANFGTDERSKFVCMTGSGTVLIGHNGTTAVGYVPPAGRKIRIPNVIFRQCTTAARATNAIPHATIATRPEFATTSAGAIDIEKAYSDWYWNFAQPYSVRLIDSVTADSTNISECATAVVLTNFNNSTTAGIDARSLQLTSNFAGGTLTDCRLERYLAGTSDHAIEAIYCSGFVFNNVTSGILQFARSSGYGFQIAQCTNVEINNSTTLNSRLNVVTSSNVRINDHDHVDRIVGTTNTTSGEYAVSVSAQSNNVVVDGVTFGLRDLIANCHPYAGVFNAGQSQDITFRNLGTRSAFANGGTANQPAYIFVSSGNNQRVRVQRCYMTPTRTGAVSATNSDKGNLYEHVYGDYADTITIAGLNETARNCGGTNTTTGQASVYGTHFWDAFSSDTGARVVLSLNEPTAETAPYVTIVSGTPRFTSAGNVSMPTVGDELIVEQHYFVKACTALTNTAPIVTGANVTYSSGARWGNHDIYFQVDKGSGFNGTWLNLTAAELAAAGTGIDPAVGFRLKYRMVCAVANTGNLLTYIRVVGTTTLAAQAANLYPLDTTTLTITGLQSGSDVVVLQAGTGNVLGSVDSYAGTAWGFVYEVAQNVDIGIIKPGYVPLYIRNYALGASNASLPVAQTIDRNYA